MQKTNAPQGGGELRYGFIVHDPEAPFGGE